MSEFFRFLIDPLMIMTMLVGMVIGALAARSLCQRGALPNETAWQLAAYGGGSLLGGLLLGFLAFLYFQIPGGQGPGVLDWLFLLLLIGAAVGAWGGGVLGKRRLSPEKALWQIVAYGGGMLLGGLLGFLLMLLLTLTSPGGPAVPSTMPTPTPTATLPGATATATPTTLKPTATATPTTLKPTATPTTPPNKATAILTPTLTPTPTGIPPLPANFSLTLSATGESVCGYPDFQAPYDVTIEYDAMTLFQVDAGITTTGAYDPATGAFNTSVSGVPGIPGTEIYDGAITFDGTTITMAGTYTYVDDPNYCEGEWTIFGETTP